MAGGASFETMTDLLKQVAVEVFEKSGDAILSLDREGKVCLFNAAAERLFGYARDEIIGAPLDQLLPERVRAIHPALIDQFAESKDTAWPSPLKSTVTGRTKSGDIVDLDISIQKHGPDAPVRFTAICRDVTAVVERNREIAENEARYSRAQRIAKVGSWEWDIQTDEIFWSAEIYRIFGRKPHEFKPTYPRFLESIHPDDVDNVQETVAACVENLEPYNIVHRIVCPDGTEKIVKEAGEVLCNPNNEPIRMDGTVQDITESWRQRQELLDTKQKALQANHVKDQFLATMSHELRTPLNAIIGFSTLLAGKKDADLNPAETKTFAGHIKDSGHYLLSLINNILDISRIDMGAIDIHPGEFSGEDLLGNCCTMASQLCVDQTIELKTKVSDDLPLIFSDFVRCEQIVVNLLTNAIKFSKDGGAVEVSLHREGDRFVISVSDEGIGIAPGKMETIFQPFKQADMAMDRCYEGAGLGLAIVQSLTDALGGEVWVESELNEGSTFRVALPLVHKTSSTEMQQETA